MTDELPDDFEHGRLLRLQKVLRELSRQVDLRLEGMSVAQVGKLLGLSRPAVYRRQRILRKLARNGINRR